MNSFSEKAAQTPQAKGAVDHEIELGAVTPGYKADKVAIVGMLDRALASEIVCVLRYKSHQFHADGPFANEVAEVFREHAEEEAKHANWIAERISQLGSNPNFNPSHLAERSFSKYVEASTVYDLVKENLIAERAVIDIYRDMIGSIGVSDSTTRRLIEKILEDEEEHADELVKFLPRDKRSVEVSRDEAGKSESATMPSPAVGRKRSHDLSKGL